MFYNKKGQSCALSATNFSLFQESSVRGGELPFAWIWRKPKSCAHTPNLVKFLAWEVHSLAVSQVSHAPPLKPNSRRFLFAATAFFWSLALAPGRLHQSRFFWLAWRGTPWCLLLCTSACNSCQGRMCEYKSWLTPGSACSGTWIWAPKLRSRLLHIWILVFRVSGNEVARDRIEQPTKNPKSWLVRQRRPVKKKNISEASKEGSCKTASAYFSQKLFVAFLKML